MYKKYLDFATEFVKDAGALMKKNFHLNMRKEWKSDNTPVTETDILINNDLIEKVKINFPDHSLLWEENNYRLNESEYTWICDPVDWTIPFSHWIPVSVCAIALVYKKEVIVSAVYDPFMDRLFYASKWDWTFLNWNRIYVNKESEIKNKSIGLIDWKGSPYNFDNLRIKLRNNWAKLMDAISIIYFWCMVACWEFSATIFPKWDLPNNASIKLLVEEAGGKVTDLFGNNISYDKEWNTGQLVSNWIIHNDLLDIMKRELEK